MTSSHVQYEEFHTRFDGSAIATYLLVMIIVPLKLWCRRATSGSFNFGWDDYFCIISLGFANAFFWVVMFGLRPALGKHVETEVSTAAIIGFLKALFAAQLLYVFSIAMIKFALLSFYYRLFAVAARLPIWIMTFANAAWAVAIVLVFIFECDPIEAYWDITITDAKCLSIHNIYLGGSLPNVLTDIIVLLMPLPYILRLQASVARRVGLAGMFLLGTFVTVVSIVRWILLIKINFATNNDVTYTIREVIIWSLVEINVALVGACLPSMRPAFKLLGLDRTFSTIKRSISHSHHKRSKLSSVTPNTINSSMPRTIGSEGKGKKKGLSGGLFSTITGLGSTKDDDEESFRIIDNTSHGLGVNRTEVELGRMSSQSSSESHRVAVAEGDGIRVKTEVIVSAGSERA